MFDIKKVKLNRRLQQLYNSNDYNELLTILQDYNIACRIPFFATGMSCYFNDQVDNNGLSNTKLSKEDLEDAKYIASCFGKVLNYSANNLSTLYVTLLGTVEFNYGMQSFPSGIYEDVLQCAEDHTLPISPLVGESEANYYCRVLDYKISQIDNFPVDKRIEVLARAKKLITKFCNGKNRIYLIPLENIIHNKASFGDVSGLRDGNLTGEELKMKLNTIPTLHELIGSNNYWNLYSDPNLTSEFGVAIYGQISNKGITYFEIDRMYDVIQKKAQQLGYAIGELIPYELVLNPYSEEKSRK